MTIKISKLKKLFGACGVLCIADTYGQWQSRLQHRSAICIIIQVYLLCRSQRSRGLRRRSTAARLLWSWVRIPPGAWMFVCCECCVLSGRGFCDGLITRPEKSCRLWCVVVCDLETTKIAVNEEEAKAHEGAIAPKKMAPVIWISSNSFIIFDVILTVRRR